MEKRNVSITLEKAKEWYQKGGELKEIALQVYEETELLDWPISINDSRLDLGVSKEYAPTKIWYQWKLYKLLSILNPKDFNPGYDKFYIPRIWWYKNVEDIFNTETFVGRVKTNKNEALYVSIGGSSGDGFLAGFFAGASADAFSHAWSDGCYINQLKCATPYIQEHLEKYFWKDIIKAYCGELIISIEEK